MTVAINVLVVTRNGLAPMSAALEFGVVNVDTGVDDIDHDTLATVSVILVGAEGAEVQRIAVADTRKPLLQPSRVSACATPSITRKHTQGACFWVSRA